MNGSKFSEVKTPESLRISFANSENQRPLVSNSNFSFAKGMMVLNPLKHSTVVPHTDIYSSFSNRAQPIPKRSGSIDKLFFISNHQAPVHDEIVNPTIFRSKENGIPPWRQVTQEPDIEITSTLVPLTGPPSARDELDFTPSQHPRTRFENRLRKSKAHESVILNRKYSYQMAKLSRRSISGFNRSQKHKNVESKWDEVMSMPKELISNSHDRFMDIVPADFCGKSRGNNELRFRGTIDPVSVSLEKSTNGGNFFKAPEMMIGFSPTKIKNRLPVSMRSGLHPQAQMTLQPRTSLHEPQVVSRTGREQCSHSPGRQRENTSRMRSLIPTIPQSVQLNTSVRKELRIPPFLFPNTARANIHRQGDSEPCPSILKCNSFNSGFRHLYKPDICTGASRLNTQHQNYAGPELYIKVPRSNIFIPALKYQHHSLQTKFRSVPGTQTHGPLYTLSNQIVRFADNLLLTFTAYLEVDSYTSSAAISENGHFFVVAGYLVLHYSIPTTVTEQHQLAAPATVCGNRPIYDLLSQWPPIGQMTSNTVYGHVP